MSLDFKKCIDKRLLELAIPKARFVGTVKMYAMPKELHLKMVLHDEHPLVQKARLLVQDGREFYSMKEL